jgi:hypothetical protein
LTLAPVPSLRTVTFGSLDGGAWGAAWSDTQPLLVIGATASATPPSAILGAALSGAESTEDWRLTGDGIELVVSGHAEPIHGVLERGADGFDQLCRIQGEASVDGSQIEVDCLGRRAARSALDLARYQSIRDVSAFFEPDEGLALTALRPRKAKSQAKDTIIAAVLDVTGAKTVADPRLSTTYRADGAPWRVGLELWLDEDDGEQYPRRAAGESLGVGSTAAGGELSLRAELLRCHSHGRDGAGVYLLATRSG